MRRDGSPWREAARDFNAGLSRRWLWSALAWNDIRHRYVGSWLGSLWIMANVGVMVLCLTFVFAGPLGVSPSEYAPFVAIGLVLWQFIQTSVNEGCTAFVGAGETIRHSPMPLSVHVLRLFWRNLLVLGHNAIVIAIVLLVFGRRPEPSAWLALPGLALLLLDLFAAILLLGLVGARFRDTGQIFANLMQLMFFVTPIFWLPSALGPGRGWFVDFNPVFAFIDIVRSPLLGESPASASWPMAAAVTAATTVAAAIAFARLRGRVAYWV